MIRAVGLIGLALLTGCIPRTPNPHYELGKPYAVRGTWFYPNENYDLDDTGLASVYGSGHDSLTSNGEAFDRSEVSAGHPTLQLPAVARLTNLENGRSVLVRINDRGAGNPARLVDVTPRAAVLLGMREDGATRVRLQVLPAESRAAADALPGRPRLAMATAPRGVVASSDLPPPPGMRAEGTPIRAAGAPASAGDTPAVIARLPETVTQTAAQPGRLWVRLDTFEDYIYAAVQRARVSDMGAGIQETYDGRVHRFWARIGPFDTVPLSENALRRALDRGIPDARIVVEP